MFQCRCVMFEKSRNCLLEKYPIITSFTCNKQLLQIGINSLKIIQQKWGKFKYFHQNIFIIIHWNNAMNVCFFLSSVQKYSSRGKIGFIGRVWCQYKLFRFKIGNILWPVLQPFNSCLMFHLKKIFRLYHKQ